MYEVFEHTADLGLRVTAPTREQLFAEAARGLFSLIVTNLDDVRLVQTVTLEVAGADVEYLFFDWLNELLYRYETENLLLAKFEINLHPTGLDATAWGEPLDHERHQMEHEVKAITYHDLKVERHGEEWLAEVIVDI